MDLVPFYLERFRQGDCDEAFFGLIEAAHDVLPLLIDAFHNETDNQLRAFIVEVIWQHRVPSSVPFLTSVLSDPVAEVWQQAIDGLVTLASVGGADALRQVRSSQFSSAAHGDKQQWIDEAIEQVGR